MIGILFGLGLWSALYAASLLITGHAWPLANLVLAAALAAVACRPIQDEKADILRAGRGGRELEKADIRAAGGGERQPERADIPNPPIWLKIFFAAACLLATAAVVEHNLRFPDGGYDAWMIWNTRARFLVRAADFHTAFSKDLLFWLHQDYPWLVPGVVAQAFLEAKSQSLAIPAVIGWIFGALALALTVLLAIRLRGSRHGLLAGLVLATTPCFATFTSNQQSDVPLAAFFAVAIGLLIIAIEEGRDHLLLLSGFSAGLGAWTKNEGLFYVACVALALAWRDKKPRRFALFLLGAAPLLALLAGFKLALDPPNDFVLFTTLGGLIANALDLRRWGELVLLTLRRIVYFQDFAFWVVAELVFLILCVRKRPPTVAGLALFLACAIYAPVYVLQPHPIDWIYRTSIDRIFIQLWPAALLATLASVTDRAPATART